MGRFATVLNLLSVVVVIFAAAMLMPLGVSLMQEDGAEGAYDLAIRPAPYGSAVPPRARGPLAAFHRRHASRLHLASGPVN